MSKWKPIQTVPISDVRILLYDETEGICTGNYSENGWFMEPFQGGDADTCLFDVTHWMPLPEVPNE